MTSLDRHLNHSAVLGLLKRSLAAIVPAKLLEAAEHGLVTLTAPECLEKGIVNVLVGR